MDAEHEHELKDVLETMSGSLAAARTALQTIKNR